MTHVSKDKKSKVIHSVDQINRHTLSDVDMILPKDGTVPPIQSWNYNLKPSDLLSWPDSSNKVYREDRKKNTIQVREFEGEYKIQLDHYHPKYNPVLHYVKDLPPKKKAIVASGVVAGGYAAIKSN